MNDQKRLPEGVRGGGQWTTEARDESAITLSPTERPAHRDILDAACERYGIDEALTGADGRTLGEAWDDYFEVTTQPEVQSVDSAIRDLMGDPNFGRERGGPYLVWHDPAIDSLSDEDWNGNPTGQWADVTADNIDDPRGRTLAAHVHTRNGGGNRECWCNDENHPDGPCTAVIVDQLAARDDHLHDEDGDFDRTYADFYFKLPNDPRLIAAVKSDEFTRRQNGRKTHLASIESGDVPPWVVLPVNEETKAKREAAYERERAKAPEMPRDLRVYGPTGAIKQEYLDFTTAVLDAAAKNDSTLLPPDQRSLRVSHQLGGFLDRRRDALTTVRRIDDVMREVQSGTLPPAAAAYIGTPAKLASERDRAAQEADRLSKTIEVTTRSIQEQHDFFEGTLAHYTSARSAREEKDRLDWAMRWPDDADTCPPRPAKSKPDTDSWE
jgi:hypothetical protein